MITIVAYHVQEGGEIGARHERWGGGDYIGLLQMQADSARWAVPHCRLVLCTDMLTEVPSDLPYERHRRQRGDYRVGAHRMESHAAFLGNQPPGKYLFIDTDVLLNQDPTELFKDWDVAVTASFPMGRKLNSGVVYVNNVQAGIEWFSTVAEAVHQLEPEEQTWMGDQYVQQNMVFGKEPIDKPHDARISWAGRGIQLLPCDYANWSPRAVEGPADGEHAYIWHLKGPPQTPHGAFPCLFEGKAVAMKRLGRQKGGNLKKISVKKAPQKASSPKSGPATALKGCEAK